MSQSDSTAEADEVDLQLVRLPVEKPGPAVDFLKARSRGVMDLIAHFWERLAHTPPLQRPDLHLVAAAPNKSKHININTLQNEAIGFSGAMLYVPKAHRADVLALAPSAAAAFAAYIASHGAKVEKGEPAEGAGLYPGISFPVVDLTGPRSTEAVALPADAAAFKFSTGPKASIDFLTGAAQGIAWMTPHLLPLVHKRAPARQLVNVVMQLPVEVPTSADTHVRLARDADIPLLNRWRRLYKEERGILFDADMDAWVQHQRVFVLETSFEGVGKEPKEGGDSPEEQVVMPPTAVVAVAKIDLDLQSLVEIGGVYTFPEYRNQGFGAALVRHLAWHIRQQGKVPTLQVDEQNGVALRLYQHAGWKEMGRLARVWLTG